MPIKPADTDTLTALVAHLAAGGIAAIPTETVYGLAADATQADAVAQIYAVKQRPQFNPLICHVTGLDMARELVHLPPLAETVIQTFWPGPLTLVLPVKPDCTVSALARAGLNTLAVRAPAHPVTQQILEGLNRPLAAPSANLSGRLSPTKADHVEVGLGDRLDWIIDGGPCRVGLESSIVAVDTDRLALLRPGAITPEQLEKATGQPIHKEKGDTIRAPGQLTSHYAPAQSLRMNVMEAAPDEFHIGFGAIAGDVSLSDTGDLKEAAARLFDTLAQADRSGKPIAVAPIPNTGMGLAINDRLTRATAPRDTSISAD